MEIDHNGGIINNRLAKTVIRSKERMTYNNVNKILSGDSELCEKYAHLTETLTEMARLAEILREKRTKRGTKLVDIKPSITLLSLEAEENCLLLRLRLPAGNEFNLNTSVVLEAFEVYFEGKLGSAYTKRTRIVAKSGVNFI